MNDFGISGFDHIVLSCTSVPDIVSFYGEVLGLQTGEERPGKWAIWFGRNKISLQDENDKPELASGTHPGTANFCLLAETEVSEIAEHLRDRGVEVLATGPRQGATGTIDSIYFRDPDGNLVEIANSL